MALKHREIRVRFDLMDVPQSGDTNQAGTTLSDGKSTGLDLRDHRIEAVIENPGASFAAGILNIRIFGMKLADMNAYSTNEINKLMIKSNQIRVWAGDVGKPVQQVFSGTISRAWIDYASAPDVSFNVQAQSGFWYAAAKAPALSVKGEVDAAELIGQLAKQMGMDFQNKWKVSVLIKNPALTGTLFEQIRYVAKIASIPMSVENDTVTIWQNDGGRDDYTIDLKPDTGLIGYPSFDMAGLLVKSEFQPQATTGRKVMLTTSVHKASGEWYAHRVTHELSVMTPGGPWFTNMTLAPKGWFVRS